MLKEILCLFISAYISNENLFFQVDSFYIFSLIPFAWNKTVGGRYLSFFFATEAAYLFAWRCIFNIHTLQHSNDAASERRWKNENFGNRKEKKNYAITKWRRQLHDFFFKFNLLVSIRRKKLWFTCKKLTVQYHLINFGSPLITWIFLLFLDALWI